TLLVSASCIDAQADTRESSRAESRAATPSRTRELSAEDAKRYRDAANLAWMYLDANYQPSTGFVNATPNWMNTTMWDVGGQLLGFHAAKGLGLISPAEFDKRMTKTLGTLETLSLFRNIAFQKVYDTRTGGASRSRGFVATDLGRFLVAMRVLSVTEPQLA